MVFLPDRPLRPRTRLVGDDTFIADNLKRVSERLKQIPPEKTVVVVVATEWKLGVWPTFRSGFAYRATNGWEIVGDGFLSKADKGASISAVWSK